MPRTVWKHSGGRKGLDAVTSSGAGTASIAPYENWALQVTFSATSTALGPTVAVALQGTLDTLSTAPIYSTLVSWSSTGQTTGDTVYQTGRPAAKVRAVATTVSATSTAHTVTVNAWYSGA